MILGSLSNISNEIRLYPPALQTGLKFLLETDVSSIQLGRHEIDGSKIYAMVSEYETQVKKLRRPEVHKKYADIQYIHSGVELIGFGPLAAAGDIDEDYLARKDVLYYKSMANETDMILSQGMFAVYFPWDVHRPNCTAGEKAGRVRKVVVKIAVDELKQ